MKCSVSVMWGCGGLVMSIFFTIFVCFVAKYGIEINKMYFDNKCGGGGLEIT